MRNRDYYRYRDRSPFSEERIKRFREHRRRSRVFFGMALALLGLVLLLKTLGIIPYYLFRISTSWPFILILIGLFIAIKSNFRNNAWWILVIIGAVNIIPSFTFMGQPSSHLVWPGVIILIGLAIAFRPHRDHCITPPRAMTSSINTDNTLNIDATFGGRKEVVTSKDFKGGVVSVTFAGCELNLTQADFTEPVVTLECRISFGGLEIVVPSHWEVQNEINPSFGNVEDSRTIQTATTNENRKTLILRGNCSFGSIELKSY